MGTKTIFFDIDGTLMTSKERTQFYIPPKTLSALRLLKENGHRIAICSGRQEAFVNRYFPGIFSDFVVQNGAHVMLDGKTVKYDFFSLERLQELCAHFDSFGCAYVLVGNEHGWGKRIPKSFLPLVDESYGLPDYLCTEWEPREVRASMIDMIFEDDAAYEYQKAAITDDMVLNRHPDYFSSDISFKGQDKASGIGAFLAASGVEKRDAIAFGDGYNDITMMGAVGLGVAMGNAVQEVKDAAEYITDSILDDGIYNALKYLELI